MVCQQDCLIVAEVLLPPGKNTIQLGCRLHINFCCCCVGSAAIELYNPWLMCEYYRVLLWWCNFLPFHRQNTKKGSQKHRIGVDISSNKCLWIVFFNNFWKWRWFKSMRRQKEDGYIADCVCACACVWVWDGAKGDVFVHLLSSLINSCQKGSVNKHNLFLACLSTTVKLLHSYKLSKGTYIAWERECVSVLPCFCLVWRKWGAGFSCSVL
jgi:hypothetical protein